ncbi:MAG: ABC transporter ATP-binding protein [Spirochaetales bacterium]|jgi:NitT/TauT family transport system ATP-binding protein|nr:ABC transporter ATP-binding protein [Spirochaetales bacterium]
MKIVAADVQKRFVLSGKQRISSDGTETAELQVLKDFNLQVNAGEFLVIVGPSGCGKSVFLNILGGLAHKTDGSVTIDGNEVTEPNEQLGYVFQQYALFPWRTALSNIEYPLEIRGVNAAERQKKARDLLRLIGLTSFEKWRPNQLSGGMQQRIAIARALAINPEVLLMDEPFAALDNQTRELLQVELLRIWEGIHNTVVFVTHSIEEAVFLADRVVIMTSRPGKVKEIVSINIPRPRNDYTRSSTKFAGYRQRVWDILKDEVYKTQDNMEKSALSSQL